MKRSLGELIGLYVYMYVFTLLAARGGYKFGGNAQLVTDLDKFNEIIALGFNTPRRVSYIYSFSGY